MVVKSPSAVFTVPVESFRRIPTPDAVDGDLNTYVAVVNVFDLPDLSEWRKINVRDPKITGAVPKAIRKSLDENPEMFVFLNRGLVLTAKAVKFDNTAREVEIIFTDNDIHGLLDGGHTMRVIRSYREDVEQDELSGDQQAFIRVELLEGFNADQIVEVVEARNTSKQVKNQSLLNLQGAFNKIKSKLEQQNYADLVAYKEHEVSEGTDATGERPKPIDVRDLISYLTLFELSSYGDDDHPIIAYNNKGTCLTRFEQNSGEYGKILPVLPDILEIWDYIHLNLPKWYGDSRKDRGQRSRFGGIKGVKTLKHPRSLPLYFTGGKSMYSIPSAFKYPILAALRSLLGVRSNGYAWTHNPIAALDSGLGKQLADVVLSAAMVYGSHTRLGKSAAVWDQCYNKAQIWALRNAS